MRNSYVSLCGVPNHNCVGSLTTIGKHSLKTHSTPQEAFCCMKKYLTSQGFKQVGSREFKDPTDGSIRVLTKPFRFGGRCRRGKNESNQTTRKIFDGVGGMIFSV